MMRVCVRVCVCLTQVCQCLLVPGPGGYTGQFFIRGVGEEDVEVGGAVQVEHLLQLLHVQVGPEERGRSGERVNPGDLQIKE